jgi:hypothetical protein
MHHEPRIATPRTWLFLIGLLATLAATTSAQAQPSPAAPPQAAPPAAPSPHTPASAEPTMSTPEIDAELDVGEQKWSKGVSSDERRAARELFLEGNRLFRVPLFARAATQYQAALTKWKHPAFFFNLALAQVNLGQEVEARASLEEAIRYGQAPLGTDEFQEAQKQLRDLERQLGRIRVQCETDGAEVFMDGAALFIGPGSYEGWVKAGPHELTAKKPNHISEARRVTVASGKLESLELRLVTLEQATEGSRRWSAWKPWAVVAAGTAVAVGGGVFHSRAAANFSSYDDAFLRLPCVTAEDSPGCTRADIGATLNDQLDKARQQQTIAIGAYAFGGALIATGAVLLYMNRPQLVEDSPPYSTGRVTLVPELSPGTFGFALSVSH